MDDDDIATQHRDSLTSQPSIAFQSATEARELFELYVKENFAGTNRTNGLALAAVVAVFVVFSALGLFALLIPATYAVGGQVLYRSHGWRLYQPGVGGARFVALNGVAWTLYAVTLLLASVNFFLGDIVLSLFGFGTGMSSYALIVTALLTYQNDDATRARAQVDAPADLDLKRLDDRTFNEDLAKSLLHNGEGPTDLWWLFIGFNSTLCLLAGATAGVVEFRASSPSLRMSATFLIIFMLAVSTALTNAIGGQWKHVDSGFLAFQPGKGGPKFVALQGLGWTLFALAMFTGLLAWLNDAQRFTGGKASVPGPLLAATGVLGIAAHAFISTSLFFYVGPLRVTKHAGYQTSMFTSMLRKTHFLGLNIIFGGGTTADTARKASSLKSYDDWMEGEKRYAELTARSGRTGDSYLVIGVGFVGKRLVQRLLDRGETKIRLFDIVAKNPFEGNPNIEYVRGDVTKYDQVLKACEGVDTVYSTFAIIRFMDRLEHQAALSYRINVGGTENVLRACKEANVKRVVVTSSSHATTDEHSLPRLNRDETAPYVVRETAHNHYGWTKAAADIMCLKANGELCANGEPIKIAIVRPCSGVFGGDDRIALQRALELGVFPGFGAKSIMDWVYVENVVLGHVLLEGAMQRGDPGVCGEAFNISNNEAVKNEDFWFSVMDVIQRFVHPEKRKSGLEFMFIPEAPLWAVAYLSELNQKIFKGRVSLGRDIDTLTPGMLATATLSYSYNSDKAEKYLGYKPAYTLDQAIQKSLYTYWENAFPETKSKQQ